MSIHPQERHHINSTQARRRLESGHPELWVECPQCHSSAGRTCFVGVLWELPIERGGRSISKSNCSMWPLQPWPEQLGRQSAGGCE